MGELMREQSDFHLLFCDGLIYSVSDDMLCGESIIPQDSCCHLC